MGQKLIISESEKLNIRSLYEQKTFSDIDYSFIIGKEFPFYNDKKEGKQEPMFVGKIIKVTPKIEGVATGTSHMLPGKAFHEYKIYQFFDIEIISSKTNQFTPNKNYRFIYVCEYRSFQPTREFQTMSQGKYFENFELTNKISPICSDPELKTNGVIKFPK